MASLGPRNKLTSPSEQGSPNSIVAREGSFSTAIFNSDIQLRVFSPFRVLYVCPVVASLKATYAENSHIVLSSRY